MVDVSDFHPGSRGGYDASYKQSHVYHAPPISGYGVGSLLKNHWGKLLLASAAASAYGTVGTHAYLEHRKRKREEEALEPYEFLAVPIQETSVDEAIHRETHKPREGKLVEILTTKTSKFNALRRGRDGVVDVRSANHKPVLMGQLRRQRRDKMRKTKKLHP